MNDFLSNETKELFALCENLLVDLGSSSSNSMEVFFFYVGVSH